jgi:hypothetical protein
MIEGIGKVYLGTKEIVKAYLGNKVVYNSAPAPFLPTDIAGCQLWLDAADATTISIGTGVSQWNDKSGNTRNAIQATAASQPAYITAGKNGLNLVRFDGSNDGMTGVYFAPTSLHSVFVVVKNNSGSFGRIFSCAISTDVDDFNFFSNYIPIFRNGTANEMATFQGASRGIVAYDNDWGLFIHERGVSNTVNTYKLNNTSYSNLAVSGIINQYRIGFNTSVNGNMNGDIAEVVTYDKILTTTERSDLLNYLSTKWAI